MPSVQLFHSAAPKRHVSHLLLLGIYLELAEKYNEILIRWFSANVVDTTLLTQRRPLKKIDLNLEFCDCLY